MNYIDHLLPILEAYNEKYDITQVEIKVDHLRPIFERVGYVDRIFWEVFLFDAKHILAQIKTYNQRSAVYGDVERHARIQVAQNLNYCWRRFVLCKEMYQCVLDKEQKFRTSDANSLIKLTELLVSDLFQEVSSNNRFDPFVTENQAEILAIETLMPFELRRVHCDELDKGRINHRQLSLRYRVPVEYVHLAMSDGYISAIDRIRGDRLVNI